MPKIRSVLVTGTSTGIGRACALRLARKGVRVFAVVRRQEDANSLKKDTNGAIFPLIFDIANEQERERAISELKENLNGDGLYGLVNNAAVVLPGPIEFCPISELRLQLEVNLIATIALCQACIPLLRKTRGRIINIGSASHRVSTPFLGFYTITKWGMLGLHQLLRLELSPWGIECILVVPGSTKSSIWKGVPTWQEDFSRLPDKALELYGDLSEAFRKLAADAAKNGMPAEKVAKTIEYALISKRPKAEIAVGFDAKYICSTISFLPTRIREFLTVSLFNIPKRKSKC